MLSGHLVFLGDTVDYREWRWVVLVTLVLVLISSLPYLVAWAVTPEGTHFTGLISNFTDGHSYIAKMRQGFVGSWSFRLPYTPEPHNGAPVYLFYLFWGHVARWTDLPLIVVYQGARVMGGVTMLLALYALASRLSDDVGERWITFVLAALGSGLGWLAGMGWWRIVHPRIRERGQILLRGLIVTFCSMTPIFLLLMPLPVVMAGDRRFYLEGGEWAVLEWLRDEAESNAVVLCSPQTGVFVPAWAGQPVVYGHPFETVDAKRREAQVKAYWTGEMNLAEQESFLRENRVRYVLVGPREREGRERSEKDELWGDLVFEAGDVRVYQVGAWQENGASD